MDFAPSFVLGEMCELEERPKVGPSIFSFSPGLILLLKWVSFGEVMYNKYYFLCFPFLVEANSVGLKVCNWNFANGHYMTYILCMCWPLVYLFIFF